MKRQIPTQEELNALLQLVRKNSHVLVVDLEATCTDTEKLKELFPSEIIEFGMCLLNLNTGELVKKQIYVKPQLSAVTDFCTQLTGISYETLKSAKYFEQAIEEVKAFITECTTAASVCKMWGSFGKYDASMIARQCQLFKTQNPFKDLMHFNIKDINWADLQSRNSPGLDTAYRLRGLTMQGRHHSGVDDAVNISNLLKHILDNSKD